MDSFTKNVACLITLDSREKTEDAGFDSSKKLVIPLYQREYKWTKEKIETFISDINIRDKFLGIIILDSTETSYEVVDGQQRLTTIIVLLTALFNMYKGQKLEQEDIRKLLIGTDGKPYLLNESLGDYLIEDADGMHISVNNDNDVYFQKTSFEMAVSTAESFFQSISDYEKYKEFKSKLLDCEFVVIVNDDHTHAHPVEQIFLDINEKSHLLDAEDIFKGHCYRNYNGMTEVFREKWIKLKKCGAAFSEMKYEDLGQYLYHFLLIYDGNEVNEKLHKKGRHYLEGKSIDQTDDLMDDMIQYGNSVYSFYNNVKTDSYRFENLCVDGKDHGEIVEIRRIKSLLCCILESNVNYQKLPLFYLVWTIIRDDIFKEAIKFEDLIYIFVNIYIAGMIFVNSYGRKGKSDIDYTIRDALVSNTIDIKSVKKACTELRKTRVKEFEFNYKRKDIGFISFVSAVIDNYDPKRGVLLTDYYLGGYNYDHFIMPDNKERIIKWESDDSNSFDIKIRETLAKQYKGLLGNYLWMDSELNRSLHNYDIVYKIQHIEKWYEDHNEEIPRYISEVITFISKRSSYKALLEYKTLGSTDEAAIQEAYFEFLSDYFSEESQHKLALQLQKQFARSFRNN